MTDRAHPRFPLPDALAVAALVALVLAFFWRLAFTNLILPRGDVFAYFYPLWQYRNEMLQTGHLPLWNPYLFMGVPFLANSQTGVLYPPNWLLIPLDAPTAVKIAILAHVSWAAAGMFALARRFLRLTMLASMLAACVFALGGYITAQVEHVNQLQGLSWLPWLFLCYAETLGGKRRAVIGLALALAMQLLAGHAQSAFISGVGLSLWGLWHAARALLRRGEGSGVFEQLPSPQAGRGRRPASQTPDAPFDTFQSHGRGIGGEGFRSFIFQVGQVVRSLTPLGLLALAALFAFGLAAAQLLPTLELAHLSNRGGGLPFLDALSFSLRPQILGRSLLPDYAHPGLFSEYVAYVGVAALTLALIGFISHPHDQNVIGLALLAVAGLFLAWGAYNPAYWLLVKLVPGFDLFRAPARWLALYAFGTAVLSGYGLDSILSSSPRPESERGSGDEVSSPPPKQPSKARLPGEGSREVRSGRKLYLIPLLATLVLSLLTLLTPLAADEVPGSVLPTVEEAIPVSYTHLTLPTIYSV